MADLNGADEAILAESNFKTLAFAKTPLEEFSKLVEANVAGYVQRKHLLEGLKVFKGKIEAAETKMKVARNVGKAKQLEAEEEALCKLYDSFDIADKVASLNKEIQAMLDEGRLTAEERPLAIEHLRSRRDAAKAAEKPKTLERVEKQLDAVVKSKKTVVHPVANCAEIYALHKRLKFIERLEKRQIKTLDEDERELLRSKAKLQLEVDNLEGKSRMWFESEFEFRPRLERALAEMAKDEAEELKRAEEEAIEKQRRAEELALEQKRQEALKKEEEHHKQLMEKLEAKRLEAQARPQKEAPKAKPKEKKKVIQLDPKSLFENAHLRPEASPEASPDASEAGDAGEWEEPAEEPAPAPAPAPAAPAAAPAKAKAPEPKPKQPRPPKPVLENKWGAPPVCPDYPVEAEDELEDMAGPSLAEALHAPKPAFKKPVQPAQPQKKTWAKMDPHDFFQPPSREAQDSDDDLRALPTTSVEDEQPPVEPEPAAAPAPKEAAAPAPAPEPAPAPKAEPAKPKTRPPKAVIENKWDSPAPAPQASEDADEEVGPSLADAAALAAKAGAKKTPPPQPKKKEKKKFTKISAMDLGFDANNPNY